MIIGLVGKVGSGKSCACKYIVENYGAIYFSCDNVAKGMMAEGEISKNAELFTNENLQEKIRIEFHPKVFSRIYENILEFSRTKLTQNIAKKQIFLIETALPNADFMNKCDKVIYIDNSYDKKLKLLKEHRNYDESKINEILNSQKYYEKFYDKADYTIENNGTKEEMSNKVKEVMDEICIVCK